MSTAILEEKSLIKEFRIETKERSKTLSIYRGNILEDSSELLGISVYDQEEGKGDLYKAFQAQTNNGAHYSAERKILADGNNGWTGISTALDEHRHILYIHSDSKEGIPLQNNNLRAILKMTFATLTSFLYEGNQIHTVALPVLFRKGISQSDYTNYIHLFIYEASKFLRKNKDMESLNIYIWHAEDANHWLKVLNEKLQLSTEKEVTNQQIATLKQEILVELQTPLLQKIVPKKVLENAQQQLSKQHMSIKQFSYTGEDVVHAIVNEMCGLPVIPSDIKNLSSFRRVTTIKQRRLVIEWFADYMVSIYKFKNYIRQHTPSKLDVYHYLLLVVQVLSYSKQIVSTKEE